MLPAWVFFLPAIFSMAAAFIPMFRGRPMNGVFLGVAMVWFILGLAIIKKRSTP